MIGINENVWNAWKLRIINQTINNMPSGLVKFMIKKCFHQLDGKWKEVWKH